MEWMKRIAVNLYTACVLVVWESICLLLRGAGRLYTLIHSVLLMGVVANNTSLVAVLQEQCCGKRRFSLAYKMHFCKWPPVCSFLVRIGMCVAADMFTFVSLPSPQRPRPTSRHCRYWNKRVLHLPREMSKWETFIFVIVSFLSNISYISRQSIPVS
jgi:hypothetical protein